jgi:hypothetical protein
MPDYTDMLGENPQEPQPPGMMGGAVQPTHPIVGEMNKPAATPAEFEKRKAGWMAIFDKMQNDPSMRQAALMFGASMLQPVQPGQTQAGQFGQALVTGAGAYNAGEYAQYQQGMAEREAQRKERESAANIEQTQAQTATSRARLPGVAAESKVAAGTADTRIEQAKTEAARAKVALDSATDEAQVAKIERDVRFRKAGLQKVVDDSKVLAAVEAEYDNVALQAEATRARIKEAGALAREHGGKADISDLTVDIVKKMDPAEQRDFLLKKGRYGTATSALTQQRDMWSDLYDRLPPEDASKAGKTREQFVIDRLTASKQKDAVEMLIKAKQAGFDDAEIDQMGLLDMAKSAVAARRGSTAPGPGGVQGAIRMQFNPKTNRYEPVAK